MRKLAQDTLRLDPRSVFAHSALAWVYAHYDYDRAGCNREIDAALAVVRRMDDAERLIRQSLVIDPLSPDAYQGLGGILRDSGNLAGAERAFRQNLVIGPTFALTSILRRCSTSAIRSPMRSRKPMPRPLGLRAKLYWPGFIPHSVTDESTTPCSPS